MNHQARGEDVEAVPCGRPLTLSICTCLIRKAMKNGRHLLQHVVAMAGASAWVVKAKNKVWGELLQREMLERSLVSFPTTRREMGKGCGHSQPAGTPVMCLLLLVNVCPLVEAGVSLRLLSCRGRSPEAQMSLGVLADLGGHPSSCSLPTSSSHPPSPLHLHAGGEPQAHLRPCLRY